MRINTNVSSLVARENAQQVNKSLNSSLEKLSSGLRINKASDDASGLAIADKLRTQASSLNQSISNASSGVALVQIADKAMGEQSNILDMVKTKLQQAATATTSDEGREAIKGDIQKLLTQFDNISEQTNYNGMKLLQGNSFTFQVGEKSTNTVTASSSYAADTSHLGSNADNLTISDAHTTGAASGTAQVDTLTFGDGGGTWKAGDTATVDIKKDGSDKTWSYSYTVTQADVDNDGTTAVEDAVGTALIALINADTSEHDITASGTPAVTLTAGTTDVHYDMKGSVGKTLAGLTSSSLPNDKLTKEVANDYMSVVDGSIDKLNSVRGEFGSTQNQLESAIRNMNTQVTNIKAA